MTQNNSMEEKLFNIFPDWHNEEEIRIVVKQILKIIANELPKERLSTGIEEVRGWNDCRAEMLKKIGGK